MILPKKTLAGIVLLFFLSSCTVAYGKPSGGQIPPTFTLRHGDWHDSWGIDRNSAEGSDGFLPDLAYESVGANKDIAYSMGLWFKNNYQQRVERAKAILTYVQRWTEYGYDEDNVFMNRVAQVEWAWNADEMAYGIDEDTNTVAIGDCEDMSFFCSTLYVAAGFDVALVSPTGHVAVLIWLPELDNSNYYWDLPDDGRGEGWIWVEATGEKNPLGWTPPDFGDGYWDYYLLGFSQFTVEFSPENPKAEDDVTVEATIVTATGSLDEVSFSYTIGNVNKEMQVTASGSRFEALIPGQPDRTRVVCTVYATNTDGFEREDEFEYVVGGSPSLEIPDFLTETTVLFVILFILAAILSRTRF